MRGQIASLVRPAALLLLLALQHTACDVEEIGEQPANCPQGMPAHGSPCSDTLVCSYEKLYPGYSCTCKSEEWSCYSRYDGGTDGGQETGAGEAGLDGRADGIKDARLEGGKDGLPEAGTDAGVDHGADLAGDGSAAGAD